MTKIIFSTVLPKKKKKRSMGMEEVHYLWISVPQNSQTTGLDKHSQMGKHKNC